MDPGTNKPQMVDITKKSETHRIAHARAHVLLPPQVFGELIMKRETTTNKDIISAKGPVFTTAIIAGVMAAKRTSDTIPFCHPISLDSCDISIDLREIVGINSEIGCNSGDKGGQIVIDCIAKTSGKTGVEMEALVGANSAALCCYDMLKALSHDIVISDVKLMHKSGGKSTFNRK